MRKILVLGLLLCSSAALAQGTASNPAAPPMVGGRPLLQIKSNTVAPQPKHQSVAKRLQACLEIDDGTKGRLDCYDAIVPPKPKANPAAAKGVTDCGFVKEEDDRLTCFNGFAEKIPKF